MTFTLLPLANSVLFSAPLELKSELLIIIIIIILLLVMMLLPPSRWIVLQ